MYNTECHSDQPAPTCVDSRVKQAVGVSLLQQVFVVSLFLIFREARASLLCVFADTLSDAVSLLLLIVFTLSYGSCWTYSDNNRFLLFCFARLFHLRLRCGRQPNTASSMVSRCQGIGLASALVSVPHYGKSVAHRNVCIHVHVYTYIYIYMYLCMYACMY